VAGIANFNPTCTLGYKKGCCKTPDGTSCTCTDKYKCLEDVAANYDQQLNTAVHEILHALGFSADGFKRFSDPVTGGKLPLTDVMVDIPSFNRTETRLKIVTPTVKKEARAHFKCATLDGVELENQGSAGSKAQHWEKRLYGNELMTSSISTVGAVDSTSLISSIDSAFTRTLGRCSRASPLLHWKTPRGTNLITTPPRGLHGAGRRGVTVSPSRASRGPRANLSL
jgi:hypothetical protein